MRFGITALIRSSQKLLPGPFSSLPIELIRNILELCASEDIRMGYSLLLLSSDVRVWIHSIVYETVEIFGLRRMIEFATIFAEQALLATSVKNLLLYDDTPGDIRPSWLPPDSSFLTKILILCRGTRRLAINYIRGIPHVDGPRPYELTIRRGNRGITLKTPPFEGVTHLHCRFEQLMPSFLRKLATARLTHLCFTHHLDFSNDVCQSAVEYLLRAPRLQVLIVEVAYQKWHAFEDPSIRRALARNTDERLFVRLSTYDTVRPYDEQRVFSGKGARSSVWDVTSDLEWRVQEWDGASISQAYNLAQDRSLPGMVSND